MTQVPLTAVSPGGSSSRSGDDVRMPAATPPSAAQLDITTSSPIKVALLWGVNYACSCVSQVCPWLEWGSSSSDGLPFPLSPWGNSKVGVVSTTTSVCVCVCVCGFKHNTYFMTGTETAWPVPTHGRSGSESSRGLLTECTLVRLFHMKRLVYITCSVHFSCSAVCHGDEKEKKELLEALGCKDQWILVASCIRK